MYRNVVTDVPTLKWPDRNRSDHNRHTEKSCSSGGNIHRRT